MQILQIFKNNQHIFHAGKNKNLFNKGNGTAIIRLIFATGNKGLCMCPHKSDENMTRADHNVEDMFTPPVFKREGRTTSFQTTLYPIPLPEHLRLTLKGPSSRALFPPGAPSCRLPRLGELQGGRAFCLKVAKLKQASIPKACLLECSGSFSNICAPSGRLYL